MKKGIKETEWESSGLNLIEVFRWEVPSHLKEIYEEFKKAKADA